MLPSTVQRVQQQGHASGVRVHVLNNLMGGHPLVHSVREFPGPLLTVGSMRDTSKLQGFVQAQATRQTQCLAATYADQNHEDARTLLWFFLQVYRDFVNQQTQQYGMGCTFNQAIAQGLQQDHLKWQQQQPAGQQEVVPLSLEETLTHLQAFTDGTKIDFVYGEEDLAAAPDVLRYWKLHLALLLGQHQSGACMQMGDLLWCRYGQVEAAHLCYLMGGAAMELAGPTPQSKQEWQRLILIAGDHQRRAGLSGYDFTLDTEAVQLSEVFEQIAVKRKPDLSFAPLQLHKLGYAGLLADLGFSEKALKYVRVVQARAKRAEHEFNPAFWDLSQDMGMRLQGAVQEQRKEIQGAVVRVIGALEKGLGFFGRNIGSAASKWIESQQPQVQEANLNQDTSFYFDDKLQRYVNRDDPDWEPEEVPIVGLDDKPAPPPPPMPDGPPSGGFSFSAGNSTRYALATGLAVGPSVATTSGMPAVFVPPPM